MRDGNSPLPLVEAEPTLYVMGGGNPAVPSAHPGDWQYGLGVSGRWLIAKKVERIPETSGLDR